MELRRVLLASGTFIAFILVLTGVDMAEGLRCYQCGTFLATTSVSPCLNFTRGHLKDCPHSTCSKYVGLSATVIVYGCEANCQEKQHGSFDSYCCTDDGCNHSTPHPVPSPITILVILTSSLLLSSFMVRLHPTTTVSIKIAAGLIN